MSIKKRSKLLIFSLVFSALTFFGCATKADNAAVPDETNNITAPEEIAPSAETQADENHAEDFDINGDASFTSENNEENKDSESGENAESEDETSDSQNENDAESNNLSQGSDAEKAARPELPEIEEPLVRDAELPEEVIEIVEIPEPEPAPIPEEKVFVEEVPPLPAVVEPPIVAEETSAPEEEESHEPAVETVDTGVAEDEVTEVDEVENADDMTAEVEAENIDEEAEENIEPEIIPSRSVTLRIGEYLELEYPGKGWIYLGAIDGTKYLTSAGRKLGEKDTNFTLQAKKEGTSILHFYKEDVLAGVYIDDYIEVTVENIKSKSKTRIKAPSYAESVPKKPASKKSEEPNPETTASNQNVLEEPEKPKNIEQTPADKETSQQAQNKTEPRDATNQQAQNADSITAAPAKPAPVPEPDLAPLPELSAEELLASAKANFDAQKYSDAKRDLQIYLTVSEGGRDEALFMLGQIYESNSKEKDIKKAIETYEELMENYPVSKFWDDANKRVIYLKRFYINVR